MVNGDFEAAHGPDGFHAPSIRRIIRSCAFFAIVSSAATLDDYVPETLGGDPGGKTQASKRAVRNTIETASDATALPLGQVAPVVQFLTDWANGDAHPETIQDWTRSLTTGRANADSVRH